MSKRRTKGEAQSPEIKRGFLRKLSGTAISALAIGALGLLGLVIWPWTSRSAEGELASPPPTVAHTTVQHGRFPPYVFNSALVLTAYEMATEIPQVLPYMPCYCNCGDAHGHFNLRDCFFQPDGSYNDHAAFCDICDLIVVDVGKLYKSGNSLRQTRSFIEQKYSRYGPSTNTPPIQG